MSASAVPVKELTEEDLTEQQIHLIPKLPGQTTDEIKVQTRRVFEYADKNFTDTDVRKYLEDIHSWLYFRRLHNKQDYSIPVLDHTGKQYSELINQTLQDIDSLPANAQKLKEYKVSNKTNILNQYQQIHQKHLNLTNLHQHKHQQKLGLNLFQYHKL